MFVSSLDSSSSSSPSVPSSSFELFSLGEDGYRSAELSVFPLVHGEDRVAPFACKSSLSCEHIRGVTARFFVPPEVEVAVPRRGDTVLHSPEGFCPFYVDHFKAGLLLALFPFLLAVLTYYDIALT